MKLGFRRMYLRIYRQRYRDLYNQLDGYKVINLVSKGMVVGLGAGFAGASFRYALAYVDALRKFYMQDTSLVAVVTWLIAMTVTAIIVHYLLKWSPLAGGSGIPQIDGEMMGLFDMKPLRVLVAKYVGGVLINLGGLSLGRGGPDIQIGGAMGKLISRLFKCPLREERLLISSGASAGLAAAFSAPITGALFSFEAIHKSFYPLLVIPIFTAALVSNFVTSILFGLQPALGFTVLSGVPLDLFLYLVMLGLFIGLAGVFFNHLLLWVRKQVGKLMIPPVFKMIGTFWIISAIGYEWQVLLGSGNSLAADMSAYEYTVWTVGFLLLGKMILTAFCYSSSAPGGLFLPLVVMGAAGGTFIHHLLWYSGLIGEAYVTNFIICGISGILAASMGSPIMAIMLVLEMTNSFSNIFAVGTVTIVAYLVANTLGEAPIADTLLAGMVNDPPAGRLVQTFFQTRVPVVSPYIGQKLKELRLPAGTLIVSIERHGEHLVPTAETEIAPGDQLYISCRKDNLKASKQFFQEGTIEYHKK